MRRIIKTHFSMPKNGGTRKLNHLSHPFLRSLSSRMIQKVKKNKNNHLFSLKIRERNSDGQFSSLRSFSYILYSCHFTYNIFHSYISLPVSYSLGVYPAAAGQSTFARRTKLVALNREMSKIEKTLDTQKLSFFFLLIFLFIFF